MGGGGWGGDGGGMGDGGQIRTDRGIWLEERRSGLLSWSSVFRLLSFVLIGTRPTQGDVCERETMTAQSADGR
jgi:hypothetical protein